MTKIEEIKERLHQKQASLVVAYENGDIQAYYQNRIKDIKQILKENPQALQGSIVADKVIGKVAASILTVAGVKEIYADVISQYAIPVLEEHGVSYTFSKVVAFIKNQDNTGMCPMENKYKEVKDIRIVYQEMLDF